MPRDAPDRANSTPGMRGPLLRRTWAPVTGQQVTRHKSMRAKSPRLVISSHCFRTVHRTAGHGWTSTPARTGAGYCAATGPFGFKGPGREERLGGLPAPPLPEPRGGHLPSGPMGARAPQEGDVACPGKVEQAKMPSLKRCPAASKAAGGSFFLSDADLAAPLPRRAL